MKKNQKEKTGKFVKKFIKKDGICNICQQKAVLSEDHVPPKVCSPLKNRSIDILLYRLIDARGFKSRYTQNGVSYKTICKACNSKLGSYYDHHLGDFSHQIERFVKSNIELPPTFQVECCPNAIMRSVLGHLLAAKTETDDSKVDVLIRPCVLNESIPIPEEINIFYWIYPYEKTMILRDFVMPSVRGKLNTFAEFSLLKFYPIAFLVGYRCTSYETLNNFNDFKNFQIQHSACVDVDLASINASDWPEECRSSENFLILSKSASDSVYSIPRNPKKSTPKRLKI